MPLSPPVITADLPASRPDRDSSAHRDQGAVSWRKSFRAGSAADEAGSSRLPTCGRAGQERRCLPVGEATGHGLWHASFTGRKRCTPSPCSPPIGSPPGERGTTGRPVRAQPVVPYDRSGPPGVRRRGRWQKWQSGPALESRRRDERAGGAGPGSAFQFRMAVKLGRSGLHRTAKLRDCAPHLVATGRPSRLVD